MAIKSHSEWARRFHYLGTGEELPDPTDLLRPEIIVGEMLTTGASTERATLERAARARAKGQTPFRPASRSEHGTARTLKARSCKAPLHPRPDETGLFDRIAQQHFGRQQNGR